MINAADLQQVKLKPRDEGSRRDRSAPNFNIGSEFSKQREERLREYFFSTGMDRWYESLKDESFATEFIPMTREEGQALVTHWERLFKNRSSSDGVTEVPTFDIPAPLKGLQKRIDDVIGSLSPETGAFVKLTTRSPKDSHVAFAKARTAFQSKLPSLGDNPSANDRLILLAEVVIQSLRVRTGEEAINLFVSSTRVGEDLEYALDPQNDDFEKCTSLVVRKWVDIPLWAEFRGFVWDGKLTSIGQYNHPVRFPQLLEHRDRITADLERFFVSVKDRIPLDRYIVDFAWTFERVYLIEVNPFDGEVVFPASTGLWSWVEDRDHMMHGQLELRIRENEQDTTVLKNSIDTEWRGVVFPSPMATH